MVKIVLIVIKQIRGLVGEAPEIDNLLKVVEGVPVSIVLRPFLYTIGEIGEKIKARPGLNVVHFGTVI